MLIERTSREEAEGEGERQFNFSSALLTILSTSSSSKTNERQREGGSEKSEKIFLSRLVFSLNKKLDEGISRDRDDSPCDSIE